VEPGDLQIALGGGDTNSSLTGAAVIAGQAAAARPEWRPVPGYEGLYEVSDQGQVRSLPRTSSTGRPVRECILSTDTASTGQPKVKLYRDGESRTYRVHLLVAEAFQSPPARFRVKSRLTRKPRGPREENGEYARSIGRMLRSYGRRIAEGDTADLADFAALIALAEGEFRAAVGALRERGYSWAEVGASLGISRQAAQQRFGPGR
jgi:hypothetical protein